MLFRSRHPKGIGRGSITPNLKSRSYAVILNPAEQELGKLGGSCGDVFMRINTCKGYVRVMMAVAEGHVIILKGSTINMEVSG